MTSSMKPEVHKVSPSEEDRARANSNMHKNLLKLRLRGFGNILADRETDNQQTGRLTDGLITIPLPYRSGVIIIGYKLIKRAQHCDDSHNRPRSLCYQCMVIAVMTTTTTTATAPLLLLLLSYSILRIRFTYISPIIHNLASVFIKIIASLTSLPTVTWQEGRVAGPANHNAQRACSSKNSPSSTCQRRKFPIVKKSPLVTMGRPIFAPKITSFRCPIPKPHYLPHQWTRPTYHAKRHPDPIRRFSTMHWTDTQTHPQTDRQMVNGNGL